MTWLFRVNLGPVLRLKYACTCQGYEGKCLACVLGSDQEAMYQRYLQKQTAELEQLQQERQRLLEVQQELARMSQRSEAHKTVSTQV